MLTREDVEDIVYRNLFIGEMHGGHSFIEGQDEAVEEILQAEKISMIGSWFKAKRSKYRHFYIDNKAICGSKAQSNNISRQVGFWEYCRKCKTKKSRMQKQIETTDC